MAREIWSTTVQELIALFRGALTSLAPWLERARIATSVTAGTDGWDEISEILFKHIVEEAIRWSLPEEDMESFDLPRYEFDYDSYCGFNAVIEILSPDPKTSAESDRLLFHSFKVAPGSADLDTVIARLAARDLSTVGERMEIPYNKCSFRGLIRLRDGRQDVVDAIEIHV